MAVGRPLGAKLLLEGSEVPLIGATITSTVNQASIAYIDVVPHAAINDIKPRTHVAIAVRDFTDEAGGFPYVTAWEGEVYGYSFGKQVGSRSFSISAIDYSGYWDNVLCYFFDTQQSLGKGGLDILPAGMDIATAKAQGIKVEATTGSTVSYFKQILDEVLDANDGRTFLDAFVEVYKRIGDVNDFYHFAEERLRLSDRILLNSSGKLGELLADQEGRDWFSGIIGKAGGFTTLRNVVQDLLSLIFHDFVAPAFPSRVVKKGLTGKKLKSTTADAATVGTFIFKPNLYMIPPPLCNTFFPDEYSSFQFSRNFFKEPTRLIYQPQLPLLGQGGTLALGYSYEPDSFENFMRHVGEWSTFQGVGDFDVPKGKDPGFYNDDDSDGTYAKSDLNTKREPQFLTNEERVRGIFIAIEQMMPATTQFQGGLDQQGRQDFIKKIGRYLFFKKRFESRQLQITSHLKLSVVPGFNVLILDDSDAEQNVVAYCSSVTHRIYATEGGYTNVTLSYARSVDEQEASNTASGEPIIPAWFDPEIFGTVTKPPASKADQAGVAEAQVTLVAPSKLSDFYKSLLGGRGSKAVTDYSKTEPTLRGAVAQILAEYRTRKEKGSEDVQSFIATLTSRDYVSLVDMMDFLGASTTTKDLRSDNFVEFAGGAFDDNNADFGDAVSARQDPIAGYRAALMALRGFRG